MRIDEPGRRNQPPSRAADRPRTVTDAGTDVTQGDSGERIVIANFELSWQADRQ